MKPTEEQQAALSLFLAGDSMCIDAGAGTGKTSTLRLLAASTRRRGRYMAFSRALVDDAAGSFSGRCDVSTIHGLAMRMVGGDFRHRLGSPRMKSYEVAQYLGIDPLVITLTDGRKKRLAAGWLAGHTLRAVEQFCKTADPELTRYHFVVAEGLDLPDAQGRRTYENNQRLAAHLEGAARKAWADLSSPAGVLTYKHSAYLKLWQLSHPRISTDYLLVDEAQDVAPVMADVIARQDHAQVVYVGDANQAIFRWTGAIDAMQSFEAEHRSRLSRSFRFGDAIATVANKVLRDLGSTFELLGNPDIISTVGELAEDAPIDALLCRTNATALAEVLTAHQHGTPVHLVGGGKEVQSFARAALDLQGGKSTSFYELSCFDSWPEVQEYVRDDPAGSEIALMVKLIDQFGARALLDAVDGTAPEVPGTLVVSTAHKSKGRQWNVVRIAGDMVDVEPNEDELRLRYVAFTRAREHLDESAFRAGVEKQKVTP